MRLESLFPSVCRAPQGHRKTVLAERQKDLCWRKGNCASLSVSSFSCRVGGEPQFNGGFATRGAQMGGVCDSEDCSTYVRQDTDEDTCKLVQEIDVRIHRSPWMMEGIYEGHTKGGVREGQGKLVWANGDTYLGDFHNGLRHGQACYEYNLPRCTADRHSGDRCDVASHNPINVDHWGVQGVLHTKRGIRYEGGWRISRRHGQGSQEWPNGERYNGEWKNDTPEGRGTWLRRGGRYAGDLREGVRHGKGMLKLRNGGEYDGQWVQGRMHGYGVYIWPDARIYKGDWEDGLRHGEGTLSLPSGERYSGQWREGKKHAEGVWRWSNGRTRRGEWHNDVLVGWTSAEVFGNQPPKLTIHAGGGGGPSGKDGKGGGGSNPTREFRGYRNGSGKKTSPKRPGSSKNGQNVRSPSGAGDATISKEADKISGGRASGTPTRRAKEKPT